MKAKLLPFALGAPLLCFSLPSIAATVPAGIELSPHQQLVLGNGAEPDTLDPQFVESGFPADGIATDLFEGLVIEDSVGAIIPGQAASWQISDDGTVYTFTLRDDARWSNGEPVEAGDFVFAWRRAVDPATGNGTGHYFNTVGITNAQAIFDGKQPPESLGVEAPDSQTLVVTLERPLPYFLTMLTTKTFFPVHPETVTAHGKSWTHAENMVNNGAYRLVEWVPNEKVVLAANSGYWDSANTVLQRVTYLPLASQNAEWLRYQAGEVHMTNRVQLEMYQKVKKENPEQLHTRKLLGTYLYTFNTTKPPFDDVRVRQALSWAVDRQLIADKVMGQGEAPAFSLVPDIIPGYTPYQPAYQGWSAEQRLDQAREKLAAAGYDAGNPLKVTVTYNTSENHKKVALALAAMWKPLGVKVELHNQEWNAYLAAKKQGDFQVARSWAFGDYPEPSSLLSLFTTDHVNNESGFSDPEYDRLIEQALNSADASERAGYYQRAEQILAESMPVLPIYQYSHTRLVREQLQGLPNSPKGTLYSKDLYFTR